MLRHKVLPGITGLAQISGWRSETQGLEDMEARVGDTISTGIGFARHQITAAMTIVEVFRDDKAY